jgi:hypothetical protein
MPFTPFHLGPGAAFKVFGGRYFSFTVFGFSQVAIDVEVLVRMCRGDSILHGFTHTYLGATLIGIASILIGKPVCECCLRIWNEVVSPEGHNRFYISPWISWISALMGAMVGVYSHVFIDSIMHVHMHPLAPFSDANSLVGVISVGSLHLLCVGLGGFAAVSLLIMAVWRKANPLK